jgi:KDO2-lipid IV(A) lauroyltransferase
MKKIKHALEYAAVLLLVLPLRILPFRWAVAIGGAMGGVLWWLGIRREVSRFNLKICLPEYGRIEADRILKESYKNFCRSMVEFALMPKLRGRTSKYIEIVNLERLSNRMKDGVGVLWVAGHFGSWELLGTSFADAGIPVDFLVGKQKNAKVDRFINGLRSSMGAGIIHMGVATRGVIKSIRSGRMVAMLSDQDAGTSSVSVRFFGHPVLTPRGIGAFALKLRCPIVYAVIFRDGGSVRQTVEFEILEPDYDNLPADKEEAIIEITQLYTDCIEASIRRAPEMYFWPHRRFKHAFKYPK